jgi:hypothetical protein
VYRSHPANGINAAPNENGEFGISPFDGKNRLHDHHLLTIEEAQR